MRRILACLFVLLTMFLFDSAHAGEVLTNVSVIQMHEAGLGESLIIKKIKTSGGRFDISTNGIIALKKAGIPEKIIEAMMAGNASSEDSSDAPQAGEQPRASKQQRQTQASIGSAKMSEQGLFFALQDKKYVNIEEHKGYTKMSLMQGLFSEGKRYDVWFLIDTPKASVTMPATKKNFLMMTRIKPDPATANLYKLTAYKGKSRAAVVIRSDDISVIDVIKSEHKVDYTVKNNHDGTYLIVTDGPLAAGEYAFIVGDSDKLSVTGKKTLRFFDFSIQ